MERRDPGGNACFFLPIGSAETLEREVFYLMEMMKVGYDDVMAIPWSRRKRLVEKKDDLERKREKAQKQAMQNARRTRRSR